MHWIEIVSLRAAGRNKEKAIRLIEGQIERADRNEMKAEIRLYQHATLETDLSIHLNWNSDREDRNGSNLGLSLVEAFREFGMVSHSVWVEGV